MLRRARRAHANSLETDDEGEEKNPKKRDEAKMTRRRPSERDVYTRTAAEVPLGRIIVREQKIKKRIR